MTIRSPIDVWNIGTFDADLLTALSENSELIRSYMIADSEIERDYQASDHCGMRRHNDFAQNFYDFQDTLGRTLNDRSIRAWHYTRLTDAEVDSILRNGIEPSTLGTLRRRLDAQIAAGNLEPTQAHKIYNCSPLNSSQHDARAQKFWMTSHPLPIDYSGVVPLMASWGGEVAYFWQSDPQLIKRLKEIGVPRVIEVIVPLGSTRRTSFACTAIVATFGRTLGCNPEKCSFDIFAETALSPASILRVHSEGDEIFAKLAKGYPADFVDVEVGRWDHL